MPGITTAFAQGLAANRPAASSGNNGYYYLSTDTNGGTLYQSNGSSWVQLAAPVTPSYTGEVTGPDFKATGLTGATAASRYVGGVASGAPASGTFAIGDFTIDQTGFVWVCTTAGTPGTWTKVGGGSTTVTTKGDLQGYATTAARIPVGSDTQVLIADSTQTLGVKWAAASAGALTQLSAQTLSGTAATVTFSSISGAYSSLLLVYQARDNSASIGGDNLTLQFNADTGAHYDMSLLYALGGTPSASESRAQTSMAIGHVAGGGNSANYAAGGQILIPNYANATFFKSAIGTHFGYYSTGANANIVIEWGGGWRSTAAVTQIVLAPSTGSFIAGCSFVLYGLL